MLAVAAPLDNISGLYKRSSRTCGGSGIADATTPPPCDLVFEDQMKIGEPGGTTEKSRAVAASFWFHYGLSDYCRFDGKGEWHGDQLVLRRNIEPSPSTCRLSISFSESMATVLDPGDACRASLCTAPGPSIHGLQYRKAE